MFKSVATAQGLTEPLHKGRYELGYSHYWYKGDFFWHTKIQSDEDTWSNGTIYIKMGLYDLMTLSLEGMVWPVTSYSKYRGESFLNYTFGIDLSSPTFELIFLDLFLNIHYLENMYLDRSDQNNHKRFSYLQIGLPVRYTFLKRFTVWLAPIYAWNRSEYFENQTYTRSSYTPGLSLGFDALLFEHIYLNLNAQYVDYFQPRIVAGYRF
jgi:hypothetical protein